MRESLRRKKENALSRHRQSPDGCLCLTILELKRAQYYAQYQLLRERLARQKVGSKTRERVIAEVLKIGNKLRAIKESIREIEQAYVMAERMVPVMIGDTLHYRLTANSDRRRSCHRKVAHSQESAEMLARNMTARKRESFQAYPCRHCDAWHIGHAVVPQPKEIGRED